MYVINAYNEYMFCVFCECGICWRIQPVRTIALQNKFQHESVWEREGVSVCVVTIFPFYPAYCFCRTHCCRRRVRWYRGVVVICFASQNYTTGNLSRCCTLRAHTLSLMWMCLISTIFFFRSFVRLFFVCFTIMFWSFCWECDDHLKPNRCSVHSQ